MAKSSRKSKHARASNPQTVTASGGSRQPDVPALRGEFDGLLARLQTLRSRKALQLAFEAAPNELGRLSAANQRRRR